MINSMFITDEDKNEPIMVCKKEDTGISVNLHIQYINFMPGQHKFSVSVTDKDGKEYLNGSPNTFNFPNSNIEPKFKYSIAEVIMYIIMTKEEVENLTYITIHVKIDDELEGTNVLFLE
ncbi:hypothetical protein IV39_GL000648 [Lactiplantibacillus plantarum]|nr:hypothetical protein IV39_GL000648 [Lactiplantibacillus plantarum]